MVNSNNTEQWLAGGDCDICRRNKYCHTQCKANKQFQYEQISAVVSKMFVDTLRRAAERPKE